MRSIFAVPLIALATVAAAQDAAPRPMLSPACRTEIMTLCPSGDDRAARRQCMIANRDKISDGCKTELRTAMQARRAAGGGNGDMAAPGAMTTDPQPAPQPK